jgi:hypothetical protein
MLVIGMHVDGNAPPSTLEAAAGFGGVEFNMTVPAPYLMLQSMTDEAYAWGKRNYVKGGLLNELSDAAIDVAMSSVENAGTPHASFAFLQMGGAIARVPEDATAFSGRNAAYGMSIECVWDDPSTDDLHRDWVRATHAAVRPHAMAANYVNLVEDPGADMRAVYGDAKYDRLVSLKRRYDPTNLFRLNQNIKP